MSTGEDEPFSGLNGRLRPRKSNASPKTTTAVQKLDVKPHNDKPKRIATPSKTTSTKPEDIPNKIDVSPISQIPCPYCDKTFVSKQAVMKHTKRVHTSTSKQDFVNQCLFCNHEEIEAIEIIRHMVDSHPNQYFACLNCHSRFTSTSELAEHRLNVCEKQKTHYRNKLRQKSPKKAKSNKIDGKHECRHDDKDFSDNHGYNGVVISCELKPANIQDDADIEDNITTNLILPPNKNLSNSGLDKNAVVVLDDLQWNKRIPSNFNFHSNDADQILSRLGVVHRGPRTGETNRRDWLKIIDETNQKFERCFDTSFYSKVASNVQENLAKFLDGSFNFNPDPDNTIKTRKSKNSVAINTAEGFPILLAFEQYSRNVFDGYIPRSIAPKHKWKWDNLEHDKTLLSPEQIKRDSHANNCIITLVSSLDIWTQLCMRQKFEDKFKVSPLEKKAEKQSIIGKELKEILEKRELPATHSQVVKYVTPAVPKRDDLEFPASLGLAPATPTHDIKPAVLSGEWVRPRCYICCACGAQARDSRALSTHISTQHPNAQIQHYEIVGERLLKSDISKHLYVPPSQMNNRTRPLRGYRECTKCKKSITLEDLHQHMLDCAGDMPTVRRKCRAARLFGVRKRRARLPDNTIRKKIRKDIQSRHRKNLIRPRQKNRSEVGDAETIRKMLADLPAKRHRVLVNPLNSNIRPQRKFSNMLIIKNNLSEGRKKKAQGNVLPKLSNEENEILNKKIPNPRDGENRIIKNHLNLLPLVNRHNNTLKRNSPFNNKKNLRFKDCKGSNDQGSEGRKCSDSGKNSGNEQSGSGNNTGETPYNTRENGNRSSGGSEGRDNQQPGCSRQNDDGRDSPGQPNLPLKHSIASLTANTGTQDKAVQFHHLFLVQQEYNNVPQIVPFRKRPHYENKAVEPKQDRPIHVNNGGTLDHTNQKTKLNKPRKGLNDCIAMLRNKLVEPRSVTYKQVSIQCDVDDLDALQLLKKVERPTNSTNNTQRPRITHEIAVQCEDLDSDEPLADALMRERRANQMQQNMVQKDKGKGRVSKGKALDEKTEKLIKRSNKTNDGMKNLCDAQPSTSRQFIPINNTQETTEDTNKIHENICETASQSNNIKDTRKDISKGPENVTLTTTQLDRHKDVEKNIQKGHESVPLPVSQLNNTKNTNKANKAIKKGQGNVSAITNNLESAKDAEKNIQRGQENIQIRASQSDHTKSSNKVNKKGYGNILANTSQLHSAKNTEKNISKRPESILIPASQSDNTKKADKVIKKGQGSITSTTSQLDGAKDAEKNIQKRHESIHFSASQSDNTNSEVIKKRHGSIPTNTSHLDSAKDTEKNITKKHKNIHIPAFQSDNMKNADKVIKKGQGNIPTTTSRLDSARSVEKNIQKEHESMHMPASESDNTTKTDKVINKGHGSIPATTSQLGSAKDAAKTIQKRQESFHIPTSQSDYTTNADKVIKKGLGNIPATTYQLNNTKDAEKNIQKGHEDIHVPASQSDNTRNADKATKKVHGNIPTTTSHLDNVKDTEKNIQKRHKRVHMPASQSNNTPNDDEDIKKGHGNIPTTTSQLDSTKEVEKNIQKGHESIHITASQSDNTKNANEIIKKGLGNIPAATSQVDSTKGAEKNIHKGHESIHIPASQFDKTKNANNIIKKGHRNISEASSQIDSTKIAEKNIQKGHESTHVPELQSDNTKNADKVIKKGHGNHTVTTSQLDSTIDVEINIQKGHESIHKSASQSDNTKNANQIIKKGYGNIPAAMSQLDSAKETKKGIKKGHESVNVSQSPPEKTKDAYKVIKKIEESFTLNASLSNNTKDAKKDIKKRHENIYLTAVQSENTKDAKKNIEKEHENFFVKASLPDNFKHAKKDINKGHENISVTASQSNNIKNVKKNIRKEHENIPVYPSDNTEDCNLYVKKGQENVPITASQSNNTKSAKKDIKKGQEIVSVTGYPSDNTAKDAKKYIKRGHEIVPETGYPSDNSAKDAKKYIKTAHENIHVNSLSVNDNTRASDTEEIDPKKSFKDGKYESNSQFLNDKECGKSHFEVLNAREDINTIQVESENYNNSDLILTKKLDVINKDHYIVNQNAVGERNKTITTHSTHEQDKKTNNENLDPKINEDNAKSYNSIPMPSNYLPIQDVCQDLSVTEHSEYDSVIPPAHCNLQMEPILSVPLDLSGKISSTQSDSPIPYPMSTYDDSYETLDLSNKNPNRDMPLTNDFIEEDVVDLRVRYTTDIHYECDLSASPIPEEATDLSLTNEQIPKDLSLKGRNCSYSTVTQNNKYANIGSGRSHYDSCGSSMYEENFCLDFSIKEVQNNIPTDLSGKKDHRQGPLRGSILPVTEVESNDINDSDLATNLSFSNRVNVHDHMNNLPANAYEDYQINNQVNSNIDHQIVNHTINTDIPRQVIESSVNLVKHKTNPDVDKNKRMSMAEIEAVDLGMALISSKKLDEHDLGITIVTIYMDTPSINHQPIYTKESVSPYSYTKSTLCLADSITTSLPAYNLKNRAPVIPSTKHESTTPVYTLANACISVTKIDTSGSSSLTNMLPSIPGNTITNTTSVYTLAGTTIGTPINYNSGQNSMQTNYETTLSLISKNNAESPSHNLEDLDKSLTNTLDKANEKEKTDRITENMGSNLDQDPDTARKIALLPKELVEILGTMPSDHRQQLLNVLPQYVSTSTASSVHKEPSSLMSQPNKTKHTKLDVTSDKRYNLLNPSPPPSTLSLSSCELSPTSISSILLTPPTPNFKGRQRAKTPRDNKINTKMLEDLSMSLDEEEFENKHLSIIDLTGDDNSQPMPEVEVHTTSEISSQSITSQQTEMSSVVKPVTPKTNNDKTASLRAVRIKTQSERQRSAFSETKSKVRHNSTEIPATQLKCDEKKVKLDSNKSATIQQGEISSSQSINKNTTAECEISSSVSITNENGINRNDCYNLIHKEVIFKQNTVINKIEEIGTVIPISKTCNVSSTNLVKNNDSEYSARAASPKQSDTIISDNNNILPISKHDNKDQKDVTLKKNKKTSDDEDSDDDVSLAAIVKQRNNERPLDKSEIRVCNEDDGKDKTNIDDITSSVTTTQIMSEKSAESLQSVYNKEQSKLEVSRNIDQFENDNSNIDTKIDKNKKKVRKSRRNKNCTTKLVEHPINYELDINKENASEIENMKYKDDNIQKPTEQDSQCDSSHVEKEIAVSTTISNAKKNQDNVEQSDKNNLIDQNTDVCDLTSAESENVIDQVNKHERAGRKTGDKTHKKLVQKSLQVKVNRQDLITLQKISLIAKVENKLDLKSANNDVIEIPDSKCTDAKETIAAKSVTNDSHEDPKNINLNLVTPLRRSRRGKSLFIDSNITSIEPTSPTDIILEHKMPLTKKQLIFSKLLLDEEHNVSPISNELEVVEKNVEKIERQSAQEALKPRETNHKSENKITTTEVDPQTTKSATKSNKRKKSSRMKRSKKKKTPQDVSLPTETISVNLPLTEESSTKSKPSMESTCIANLNSSLPKADKCVTETEQKDFSPNKSIEIVNSSNDISNNKDDLIKKSGSVEKRKLNDSSYMDSPTNFLAKKSKNNNSPIQEDIISKKVLIQADMSNTENKVKARTMTCYSRPTPARRIRSKSVFVNSSDYYDPYDIDLEEMNEISESINRKTDMKKALCELKTSKRTIDNNLKKSEVEKKNTAESYEAVPSTSKSITINLDQSEKHENIQEDSKESKNTTTSDNVEIISDSDDSSKSDVPLKKYVEEKEKKSLDNQESVNKNKIVDKSSNVTGNLKSRKKNKRANDTKNQSSEIQTQSSESEAHLRSEQFMESFGFFSERKPRKSNLLATKKISETLHIIANETDDVYFGLKESRNKKTADKRHADEEKNKELELKIKIAPAEEEPNYLVAYKIQLERATMLHDKIARRKNNALPTNDIVLPTVEAMLAEAKRTVREQQIYCRGLSRDEALFVDCCELLKESHNKNHKKVEKVRHCSRPNCAQASENEHDCCARNTEEKSCNKHDDDVDSITARNILESDEVRSLENDLISGLQEAAKATKRITNNFANLKEIMPEGILKFPGCIFVNPPSLLREKQEKLEQAAKLKAKRSPEYKEKMYPDIENIDMFEDKFDKIKRKCRSQAAAASKPPQTVPEASSSHRVRKSKKKGKKKIKNHQSTVMTKGALKGFDGIKVSIVTTDINMSAIIPPTKKSSKKKRKSQSNKKRERKSSEANSKSNDGRHDEPPQKKLDVYEFMDTDDAEVFDFRPSTIMERFKSISNKETPSTSKSIGKCNEIEISSDSASDGDDFVYMSDDYVCSDDETENSIISCELKNVNDPIKKSSPHKRKEVTEKTAVMGKIFKHNAVRSDKKNSKNRDLEKPKANLDQLFDSLLEEQPSSKPVNETVTSMTSEYSSRYFRIPTPKQSDHHEDGNRNDEYDMYVESTTHKASANPNISNKIVDDTSNVDKANISSKKRRSTSSPKDHDASPKARDTSPTTFTEEYKKSSKHKPRELDTDVHSELSLKNYEHPSYNEKDKLSKHGLSPSPKSNEEESLDDFDYNRHKSKDKSRNGSKIKSSFKSSDTNKERRVSFDCPSESLDMNLSDDGGVARQRERRKCTVGKQNVLAETWSSESEPDGIPPRPNSAESIRAGSSRRRKGRKKEGHSSGNKKINNRIVKKNDLESRVNSSRSAPNDLYEAGSSRGGIARSGGFARPGPSFAATPSSSCVRSRPRPAPHYWSEGDDEQEHLQQHGWIVGDSHKKLVTMLAHAKGRKRNNDDKRHLVE